MAISAFKFVFIHPKTKVYIISKKDPDAHPNRAITARQIKSRPIQLSSVADKVNTIIAYASLEKCMCDFIRMSEKEKETSEYIVTTVDDLKKFCKIANV